MEANEVQELEEHAEHAEHDRMMMPVALKMCIRDRSASWPGSKGILRAPMRFARSWRTKAW